MNKTINLNLEKYLEIKALTKAMSNDPTRIALRKLFYDGKRSRIVATDGHILRLVYVQEWGEVSFTISPIAFNQTEKQIKETKGLSKYSTEPFDLEIEVDEKENYPDYANVIPSKDTAVKAIGIDIRLLSRLNDTFPKSKGMLIFNFVFTGEKGGVKIYLGKRLVGLFMPSRLSDDWYEMHEEKEGVAA